MFLFFSYNFAFHSKNKEHKKEKANRFLVANFHENYLFVGNNGIMEDETSIL